MKYLKYSDVALLPTYSAFNSRKDISTSCYLGNDLKRGRIFNLPVVPSNMKCTIDLPLANKLSFHGYFYVMHRFQSFDERIKMLHEMQNLGLISISIGVKNEDYDLLIYIVKNKLRI